MKFIACSHSRHAAAILRLFNDAIETSTALYEYQPRTLDSMADWFRAKQAGRFPVIGAQSPSGELMGFASYDWFRPHRAFKYTVEHSVYVDAVYRRKGLALGLMHRLIDVAREQDYHVMVGAVDAHNRASVGLHERLGFTRAGTLRQAAYKFGRWLDLAFYQLVLVTPREPVED